MKNKILVIGDSCVDEFVYGKSHRLCPEAPVPVFMPLHTVVTDGMASNVMNNLKSLGNSVDIITNKNKIVKRRYVEEEFNHLFLRVDENDKSEKIDLTDIPDLKKYSAIVISDYNKGFLSEDDIQWISSQHSLTFLDTKKKLGKWAEKLKFIKINRTEYNNNKEIIENNYILLNNTIVTLGKDGCVFRGIQYKTNIVDVKDITGAGDTFLSALVTEYVNSGNIEKALQFANTCASQVVQQCGIAVIKK